MPSHYYHDYEANSGICFDFFDFFNAEIWSRNRLKNVSKYFFAYTRCADDISISSNDIATLYLIKTEIENAFVHGINGYFLNNKKTRIQLASFGNRVITGISVGVDSIQASRVSRRKLRAALHQNNTSTANRLVQWCKLK